MSDFIQRAQDALNARPIDEHEVFLRLGEWHLIGMAINVPREDGVHETPAQLSDEVERWLAENNIGAVGLTITSVIGGISLGRKCLRFADVNHVILFKMAFA